MWDRIHLNMSTFSTQGLIWVNQKVVSQLSEPIFFCFLTEKAHDTIQYLNFVVG